MSSRTKAWLIVGVVALLGALGTWLAFGFGVQEKPVPDLTEGVELVKTRDRTAR
jgi:hypothetical protein